MNQGDGIFSYHRFPGDRADDTRVLLPIDMDNDGDDDLLTINASNLHHLYRNDSHGTFTPMGDPFGGKAIFNAGEEVIDAIAQDVNGDELTDVLILMRATGLAGTGDENKQFVSVFLGQENRFSAASVTVQTRDVPAELTFTTEAPIAFSLGETANLLKTDVNFGLTASPSTIKGAVFLDENGNGLRDVNEKETISDSILTLRGMSVFGKDIDREAVSDENGLYKLENIPPSKTVGGYVLTATLSGSTLKPTTQQSRTVPILTGGTLEVRDFGFTEAITIRGSTEKFVSVRKLDDGSLTGKTLALGGITLKLEGTSAIGEPVSRKANSNYDGEFLFEDLPLIA